MATQNADQIFGTNGADEIDALGGSDQVYANKGDDTVFGGTGTDQLFGEDGNDWMSGGADSDQLYGGKNNDTLFGGDGIDQLYGDKNEDYLDGGAGDDQLFGGKNDDTLIGGMGDDTLDGGENNDTVIYTGPASDFRVVKDGSVQSFTGYGTFNIGNKDTYVTDLNLSDGDQGTDELKNIKYIEFVQVADVTAPIVTVTEIVNTNDPTPSMSGTVDDDTATITVELDGASYAAINHGDGTWTLDGDEVATLQDGTYAVDVTATDAAGNAGTASMSMEVNNPTIQGTDQHDLIRVGYVDADGDVVLATGTNTIEAGGGDDKIFVGAANDVIFGGAGNDNIRAKAGSDTLYGDDGNDYLDGGSGTDVMAGGSGNDSYFVDDIDDQVIEVDGEGRDRIKTKVDWSLGDFVEDLWLIGDAEDLEGVGNSLNNVIVGNGFANSLTGAGGNDTMYGLDGNDTLYGGEGRDLLRAIEGQNILYGDTGNDKLYAGSGDDQLFGGNGNDTLKAGGMSDDGLFAGQDSLSGGNGNDLLIGSFDEITFLAGGAGNDTYRTVTNVDTIVEEADGGFDKIFLSCYGGTHDIAANIEKVVIVNNGWNEQTILHGTDDGQEFIVKGRADIHAGDGDDYIRLGHNMGQIGWASGGGGNDKIRGSKHTDNLYGGDGDDRLISGGNDWEYAENMQGGSGDDFIFCGSGVQHLYFYAGDDQDVVKRFDQTEDKMCFRGGLTAADVTITDIAGGQLLTYGEDDQVRVVGSDLTMDDLLFFF